MWKTLISLNRFRRSEWLRVHFLFYGAILKAEQIAAIVLPADELKGFEFVAPKLATESTRRTFRSARSILS